MERRDRWFVTFEFQLVPSRRRLEEALNLIKVRVFTIVFYWMGYRNKWTSPVEWKINAFRVGDGCQKCRGPQNCVSDGWMGDGVVATSLPCWSFAVLLMGYARGNTGTLVRPFHFRPSRMLSCVHQYCCRGQFLISFALVAFRETADCFLELERMTLIMNLHLNICNFCMYTEIHIYGYTRWMSPNPLPFQKPSSPCGPKSVTPAVIW